MDHDNFAIVLESYIIISLVQVTQVYIKKILVLDYLF